MTLEDPIQEIKHRVDIVQVIGRFVQLRGNGHHWMGLCPFHAEKTPSFSVRGDLQYFKCFGCGAGGDVFTFLQKQTGQLFWDVAQGLGAEVGIELDKRHHNESPQELEAREHQAVLQATLKQVHDYFQLSLRQSAAAARARVYLLKKRKLSKEAIMEFQVGFGGSDADLLQFLKEHHLKPQDALELGLLGRSLGSYKNFFKNRILFPLSNEKGALVGFGGRALEDSSEAKYVNSKASVLYRKSGVLFGLSKCLAALKKGEPAVLVEGYFDVLAVQSLGFAAVAPCGTSLTQAHIQMLARYTKEVILCFDSDKAGKNAHERALLALLQDGFQVKSAQNVQGDPAAMWQEGQKEDLKRALLLAGDAVESLCREWAHATQNNVSQRIAALKRILVYLSASPSTLVVHQYVRLAAQIFQEDERVLLEEMEKKGHALSLAGKFKKKEKPSPKNNWNPGDILLLHALVSHPFLVERFASSLLEEELRFELRLVISGIWEHIKKGIADPQEILRTLLVHRDPALLRILVSIARQPEKAMSEPEAVQVVVGFLKGKFDAKEAMGFVMSQKGILEAQQRGDLPAVREALLKQSEHIHQARKANKT